MFCQKFEELNKLIKKRPEKVTDNVKNDISYISYRYKKTLDDNSYLSSDDIEKVLVRLELQVDDLLFQVAR